MSNFKVKKTIRMEVPFSGNRSALKPFVKDKPTDLMVGITNIVDSIALMPKREIASEAKITGKKRSRDEESRGFFQNKVHILLDDSKENKPIESISAYKSHSDYLREIIPEKSTTDYSDSISWRPDIDPDYKLLKVVAKPLNISDPIIRENMRNTFLKKLQNRGFPFGFSGVEEYKNFKNDMTILFGEGIDFEQGSSWHGVTYNPKIDHNYFSEHSDIDLRIFAPQTKATITHIINSDRYEKRAPNPFLVALRRDGGRKTHPINTAEFNSDNKLKINTDAVEILKLLFNWNDIGTEIFKTWITKLNRPINIQLAS